MLYTVGNHCMSGKRQRSTNTHNGGTGSLTFQVWILVLMYMAHSRASAEVFTGTTTYLERGRQGVVPCPALEGRRLTPDDIDAVYWYSGPIEEYVPIVVKVDGNVNPGQGVKPGVYDVNDEFSLAISLVLDSSNGTYYCRLAPKLLSFQDGVVPVEVIVSPSTEFPVVSPTNISISADQPNINITCTFKNAKPAVEIIVRQLVPYFNSITLSGRIEEVILSSSDNTLNSSELLRINNTFTTYVYVEVEVPIGLNYFLCTGFGKAITNNRMPSTVVAVHRRNSDEEIPTQSSNDSASLSTAPSTVRYSTTCMSTDGNAPKNNTNYIVLTWVLVLINMVLISTIVVSLVRRKKGLECRGTPISKVEDAGSGSLETDPL